LLILPSYCFSAILWSAFVILSISIGGQKHKISQECKENPRKIWQYLRKERIKQRSQVVVSSEAISSLSAVVCGFQTDHPTIVIFAGIFYIFINSISSAVYVKNYRTSLVRRNSHIGHGDVIPHCMSLNFQCALLSAQCINSIGQIIKSVCLSVCVSVCHTNKLNPL